MAAMKRCFVATIAGTRASTNPTLTKGSYDPSNPQSFNRYAYLQGDPVNFVDPTGLDPERLG
jgi:hypothetical protein